MGQQVKDDKTDNYKLFTRHAKNYCATQQTHDNHMLTISADNDKTTILPIYRCCPNQFYCQFPTKT